MCGVIGIFGEGDVFSEIYSGLLTLQHRGQGGAGIFTCDKENNFHFKKGKGWVLQVFEEKHLQRLKGDIGIGHVRYPTIGKGEIEDVQPFSIDKPFGIAMAHNGNVVNYLELKQELWQRHRYHLTSHCDVEVILGVFAESLERQDLRRLSVKKVFQGVKDVFDKVRGSYSVIAIIAGKGLLAFRDPYGIKPLCFGRKGKNFCFTSESVALEVLGYNIERDVEPGEAIFVDSKKRFFSESILKKDSRPCIFEYVYFARPDSVIDGISVFKARQGLGEQLAHQIKKEGIWPDVVIPIPDTSRTCTHSLARVLGLTEEEGLIKNRFIGRTFIMSSQEERETAIMTALNPIRQVIKGKEILLIDDSIVRGTTSKRIITLVRNAGPKKVYFAVSSPPLKYPCPYGIDMQTRGEFIARNKSVLEIQNEIGADVLIYQTPEGLVKGVSGETGKKFCTACFTGEYPTPIAPEEFRQMEKDRKKFLR